MKRNKNSIAAISKRNREAAYKYFESIGLLPKDRKPKEYVLHHIDESLSKNDIERYIQWNPEDLIVMTRHEHLSHHFKNNSFHLGHKHSTKTIQQISDNRKGKNIGNTTAKGRIHVTNGIINKMVYENEIPEGFHRGRTIHKQ